MALPWTPLEWKIISRCHISCSACCSVICPYLCFSAGMTGCKGLQRKTEWPPPHPPTLPASGAWQGTHVESWPHSNSSPDRWHRDMLEQWLLAPLWKPDRHTLTVVKGMWSWWWHWIRKHHHLLSFFTNAPCLREGICFLTIWTGERAQTFRSAGVIKQNWRDLI